MDGRELKAWRKSQGLTQAQLADLLQVALRTVVYWENGATINHERMLELACKQLEVKK